MLDYWYDCYAPFAYLYANRSMGIIVCPLEDSTVYRELESGVYGYLVDDFDYVLEIL